MTAPGAAATGAVILLTGPPGVGKSTAARLVADRLAPSVHVPADDFWRFLRAGAVAPYLPDADAQNRTVTDALAAAAFGYAVGGYQVVVDGIVGPWFVDRVRDAEGRRELPLHYIVLRADEATTLARAAGRGDTALTASGPVRHMHRQFADLGRYEPHAIDTGRRTPGEVADAVLAAVRSGRVRLGPAAGVAYLGPEGRIGITT